MKAFWNAAISPEDTVPEDGPKRLQPVTTRTMLMGIVRIDQGFRFIGNLLGARFLAHQMSISPYPGKN
jgi:hypothetical protein